MSLLVLAARSIRCFSFVVCHGILIAFVEFSLAFMQMECFFVSSSYDTPSDSSLPFVHSFDVAPNPARHICVRCSLACFAVPLALFCHPAACSQSTVLLCHESCGLYTW